MARSAATLWCLGALLILNVPAAVAAPLAAGDWIAASTYPAFCSQCHGDATSPAPIGTVYPNSVGSHTKHARVQGFDCILCHNTPEGPGGAGHFDFIAPADVVLATGNPLGGGGATYDPATGAGGGVDGLDPAGGAAAAPPRWGQSSSVYCGSCHRTDVDRPGDFDHNGRLEDKDLLIFSRTWGATMVVAPINEDLNHNGVVDGGDALALLDVWHTSTEAHELGGSHGVHFDIIRGPGITQCTVCHPDNRALHQPRDTVVHFADGQTLADTEVCNGCHGVTAQSKPAWGGTVACSSCHNGTQPGHVHPDGSGLAAPDKSTYFTASGHGLDASAQYADTGNPGAGLATCQPCHLAHPTEGKHISGQRGDYTRLAPVPSDELAYTAATSEVCLSCHRPGQTMPGPLGVDAGAEAMVHSAGVLGHYGTISAAAMAFPAYGDESHFTFRPGFGCEVCHDPHGTGNLAMMRKTIDGALGGESAPSPVTLTSASPGWVQADGTGVCDACHRSGGPAHPDTHFPGNHNRASDCRQCHDQHDQSFAPNLQQASCLDCHSTAQGARRAVLADFGLRSHHVIGAVTDADCRVCHDVSQHGSGTVRLLNYNTSDGVVDYTSNAALEAFCLGCHDADGARGDTTPFSDGMAVKDMSAGWDSGSHKTGGLSCMGDGTTGCHGTAHGSLKKHLLALPYTPPVGPAYAEEEEGFCYGCHDANGPAHSNVQTEFSLASHHNVAYADQASTGSTVECVHCHNPHIATSTQPLVNPDQPAAPWTGGDTGFCLKCHDGAPPAGVVFPAQSPGTGYNKSTFVGTKHDAAGQSCTHCHKPHGSAEASLKTLRYDQLNNVTWSFGSAQYALCWQCHDEAKVVRNAAGTNANNAFGTRHNTHVRSRTASCVICHDVHAPYEAGEDGLHNFGYAVKKGWLSLGSQTLATAFRDTGTNRGSCYFSSCHGEGHNPENYTGVDANTLK